MASWSLTVVKHGLQPCPTTEATTPDNLLSLLTCSLTRIHRISSKIRSEISRVLTLRSSHSSFIFMSCPRTHNFSSLFLCQDSTAWSCGANLLLWRDHPAYAEVSRHQNPKPYWCVCTATHQICALVAAALHALRCTGSQLYGGAFMSA